MTQLQLAQKVGRKEIDISRMETGRARPDAEMKRRIAEVLQKPALEIFDCCGDAMSTANFNERLMRFLQATPERNAAINRILDGKMEAPRPGPTGPLLFGMSEGAKFLGVSRPTLWRMIKAGRLAKVEALPGSFRVRRADLEVFDGEKSEVRRPEPDVNAAGHEGDAR